MEISNETIFDCRNVITQDRKDLSHIENQISPKKIQEISSKYQQKYF